MHTRFLILTSLALVGVSGARFEFPPHWQVTMVVLLVATVGIPHGAMDHLVGRTLLQHKLGRGWLPAFFTAYLFVAALVVLGWFASPTVTVLCFFLLSAWHFGVEERTDTAWTSWHHVAAIATGGMVIWIPALCHSLELQTLLATILPRPNNAAIPIVAVVQSTGWFLAGVLFTNILLLLRKEPWEALRIASFATMFAVTPPLISFAVYFCGWHSLRALTLLKHLHPSSWAGLAIQVLPLTLITLAAAVVAAWYGSTHRGWPDALIRTTFIGLSAIAVPHLVTHIISDFATVGQLKQAATE